MNEIIKNITDAIKEQEKETKPYDTQASVRRVEGDTAWVHIPGGADETPVRLTMNAKKGDTVQVRVSGGSAFIIGNASAPPTDDTKANEAKVQSEEASLAAITAKELAEQALARSAIAIQEFTNAIITINSDIENLQDQVDGNITTWFYAYRPTDSNYPATEWFSEGTEGEHLGDLFYDTSTGYCYRWMFDGDEYGWEKITDSDVTKALADASNAQDTADSKRRVFISQPTPPYDVGDLWCVGTTGDILTCTNAKTTGQSYSSSDWEKRNKYTDDSALTTFISGTYSTDKTNLQSQIDGKAETWYQSADPSTAWTSTTLKAQHVGDLWYKTTDNTTWFYNLVNGTYKWVQEDVPTEVFDKIDGKAQIFTSQPVPPYDVGDLWCVGTNGDILTCVNSRSTGSYVSSDWQKRNKYTDDTIANQAMSSAQEAAGYASAAQASATAAQTSANNANEYASRALSGLSTVQSVAETLTWITEHGTMEHTNDQTINPYHVYFVVDSNGDYEVQGVRYSIVTEPVLANLSSYYELSIDESLNNYVGTHLALTEEGLWLLPVARSFTEEQAVDSSGNSLVTSGGDSLVFSVPSSSVDGYKVLIATGNGSTYTTAGTYIIDSTGGVVAKYTASEITIGDILNENINISSSGMSIRDGRNVLATFSDSLIELGKNSTSSAVKMCGGLAEIAYQYGQYVEDGILIQASNNDSSLMKLAELCLSALSKSGNNEENVYIKLSAGVGGSPVLSAISLVADTIDFNGNVRFMSATTWTAPTVVSNQATIRQGGFYSEGKRTYVQMEIRLANELTGDTTLTEFLQNLPVPVNTLAVLSVATSGGGYGWASVKTNGKMNLRLNKTTGTTISIYITGVYTTA